MQTERLKVNKTYKIYIDGKFPRTESGRYFLFKSKNSDETANVCHCSRKDFRDAVTAARAACHKWSKATAYNRGQIVYRIAEILEGRKEQFVSEIEQSGYTKQQAEKEVFDSIDRLIYIAGWSDKYQQVFSSVNPVSTSHFNFSVLEPMGVVSALAPNNSPLLGLVTLVANVVVGGNTLVVLASEEMPLPAVTFTEVLHSSDVPAGVVNLLTGYRSELATQFSSHMDVNAFVVTDADAGLAGLQKSCADNVKRFVNWTKADLFNSGATSPNFILDLQEVKTTWHPIGI